MSRQRLLVSLIGLSLAASVAVAAAPSDPLAGLDREQQTVLKTVAQKYRAVRTDHYHVVTSSSEATMKHVAKTMELLYYNLRYLFGQEGKFERSPVFIFSSQKEFDVYREAAAPDAPAAARGFYSSGAKAIVTYDDGDRDMLTMVLMHEGSHQFLFLVAPKAPLWFHEGVAVYLESSKWDKNKLKIGEIPKERLKHLQKTLQEGEDVSLEALIAKDFTDSFDLLDYGVAWSLVYFFAKADGGRYSPRIQKFFTMLKSGSEGDKAFHQAFAKDFGPEGFAALEKRWRTYVLDELK